MKKLLLTFAILVMVASVLGVQRKWIATTNGQMSTIANWSGGTSILTTDTLFLDSSTVYKPCTLNAATVSCAYLYTTANFLTILKIRPTGNLILRDGMFQYGLPACTFDDSGTVTLTGDGTLGIYGTSVWKGYGIFDLQGNDSLKLKSAVNSTNTIKQLIASYPGKKVVMHPGTTAQPFIFGTVHLMGGEFHVDSGGTFSMGFTDNNGLVLDNGTTLSGKGVLRIVESNGQAAAATHLKLPSLILPNGYIKIDISGAKNCSLSVQGSLKANNVYIKCSNNWAYDVYLNGDSIVSANDFSIGSTTPATAFRINCKSTVFKCSTLNDTVFNTQPTSLYLGHSKWIVDKRYSWGSLTNFLLDTSSHVITGDKARIAPSKKTYRSFTVNAPAIDTFVSNDSLYLTSDALLSLNGSFGNYLQLVTSTPGTRSYINNITSPVYSFDYLALKDMFFSATIYDTLHGADLGNNANVTFVTPVKRKKSSKLFNISNFFGF